MEGLYVRLQLEADGTDDYNSMFVFYKHPRC